MNAHFAPSKASWRKSSYSGGDHGSCLEVADGVADVLPVRDSKTPHGPVLTFPGTSLGHLRLGGARRRAAGLTYATRCC